MPDAVALVESAYRASHSAIRTRHRSPAMGRGWQKLGRRNHSVSGSDYDKYVRQCMEKETKANELGARKLQRSGRFGIQPGA